MTCGMGNCSTEECGVVEWVKRKDGLAILRERIT